MVEIALPLSLLHAETQQGLRASHQAAYGDTFVGGTHQALWAVRLGAGHAAPYWVLRDHAARGETGYALLDHDPVRRTFKAGWSLLPDQAVYAVAVAPELVFDGRVVRLDGDATLSLSCDEGSPVWIATICIAGLDDFAALRIGDALSLSLAGETFALVVDGKTLSRDSAVRRRCEVTASSPLALLDKPFAAELSWQAAGPMQARAVVEYFIGAVDWQLPDWVIGAAALVFDGATPLKAARAVVEAIGGVVESAPDGTVVCRPRHPVSVPDYAGAAVAHQFFDSEVLGAEERIAPVRGFNRVTVSNEQGGAGASASPDALEYVGEDSAGGTVRAYPNPSRPVELVHTGHPETTIVAQGEVARSETELIEFVAGRARARYPVSAILAAAWRHEDLGELTFSGGDLQAATPGYSLLELTYEVRSIDWSVGLAAADESVQFVLMDA